MIVEVLWEALQLASMIYTLWMVTGLKKYTVATREGVENSIVRINNFKFPNKKEVVESVVAEINIYVEHTLNMHWTALKRLNKEVFGDEHIVSGGG